MSKWNKVKLSTLCSRIGDGLHGTPDYAINTGFYFINGNNLESGSITISKDNKEVSEDEYLRNYIELNENSLLLGINGSIGNMAFFKGENVMLGKSSAYLNFTTDINRFYYYYFQLEGVQKYFYDVATGSTIKNLSLKSLQDFEVPKPNELEYKKIAAVLSALDDKIKLNNKINAELETMAKTLYDYWFVQFEFPSFGGVDSDEGGRRGGREPQGLRYNEPPRSATTPPEEGNEQRLQGGYKSSGGKMVYNETLKREIPEGWEVKRLEGMIDFTRGISYTSNNINDDEGIPMINLKSFNLNGTYRFDGIKFFTGKVNENKLIYKDDLLIVITDVTREAEIIGRAILSPDFNSEILCSCDVSRVDIINDTLKKNYLRYLFNSQQYHDYIKHFASGTLVLHLDLNGVLWYTDVFPPKYLQEKFEIFVNNIDSKISFNQKQNQELAALRDWLLPMLMNGQVQVEDVSANTAEQLGMVAEESGKYRH